MQGIDEDELEGELEAMQEEELQNHLLSTGHVPVSDKVGALPTTPQAAVKGKAPAQTEDDEEEELRKLQAEMAM